MELFDASDYAIRFERTLARLDRRDHEWMVHPRVADGGDFERLNHLRAGTLAHTSAELSVLRDPRARELVERAGFVAGTREIEHRAHDDTAQSE